jgi:MinD superfamily P-loop ATPase
VEKCLEACQFNAIAICWKSVMIFNELCHSLMEMRKNPSTWSHPKLPVKIGELSQYAVKMKLNLLRALWKLAMLLHLQSSRPPKKHSPYKRSFYSDDSPPGTACTFVAAVEDSDFVFLVTEATPFGLNDLKLAVERYLIWNYHLPS